MRLISAQEAANKWGITKRRVLTLCATNRIKDAELVGNIWVLPADAEKPEDARIKQPLESDDRATIKSARNSLKNVCQSSIRVLISKGYTFYEARKVLLATLSKELYSHFAYSSSENYISPEIGQYFFDFFESEGLLSSSISIVGKIKSYLCEYQSYCEDALSWSYQYINSLDKSAPYASTQFFTERYMIHTILDDLELHRQNKVLDPSCGGGNFLVLCFEKMMKEYSKEELSLQETINNALSKLYGYDIDPLLAKVAYINLKLKSVSIYLQNNQSITFKEFTEIHPNIFHPLHSTISGALDKEPEKQTVVKVGDKKRYSLDSVFYGTDTILTNPPFQTIKGMPEDLKNYLKKYYPNSKCDMCNAFIEFSSTLVAQGGNVGLVTQNSWMYLDSFSELRNTLLSSTKIEQIWELGANAFYDISGEKTNVALLRFTKETPSEKDTMVLYSLNHLQQKYIEQLLQTHQANKYSVTELQKEIADNRFDMVSTEHLKSILNDSRPYKEFATPMQGTSTGNSKELIGLFWEHQDDKDWVMVSKGGGYERWQGLNHYTVKWGNDGEYIKATKGSAIRNAAYFDDTQLVFSDTGTAGLNVRLLLPNQIFVASGPGIRISEGKPLAHLAFLNSRFASYYIRLLTPKLTIAAGYIAKLPVLKSLLFSEKLEDYARQILKAKRNRLRKRACNYEFEPLRISDLLPPISQTASEWFREDIEDEWLQLQFEEKIEKEISEAFGLTSEDMFAMERKIGHKSIYANGAEKENVLETDKTLFKVLNSNCNIKRTKNKKEELGCDGIIEYLSQATEISCQTFYNALIGSDAQNSKVMDKYKYMYLHSLLLSVLGIHRNRVECISVEKLKEIHFASEADSNTFLTWVRKNFNEVHFDSFFKKPLYYYDELSDTVRLTEKQA